MTTMHKMMVDLIVSVFYSGLKKSTTSFLFLKEADQVAPQLLSSFPAPLLMYLYTSKCSRKCLTHAKTWKMLTDPYFPQCLIAIIAFTAAIACCNYLHPKPYIAS